MFNLNQAALPLFSFAALAPEFPQSDPGYGFVPRDVNGSLDSNPISRYHKILKKHGLSLPRRYRKDRI